MEIKYKISSRFLILLMLGAIMICSSYLIYVYDPLDAIIRKVSKLSPGTLFFSIWSEPPVGVYIKLYIFNVTNTQEFLAGKEKLKLEQIGPYVYEETLANTNATFNDDGTMTYLPKRSLKFMRDMSIGDPEVDRLISPNIPLLGIQASLQKSSVWTNLAVATISNAVGSAAFVDVTIAEYLWGYDDRLVTLAHKALPNWINFERFGILDRLMAIDNAKNVVTLNMQPTRVKSSPILTEAERSAEYHIHRWNGSPGLKQWGYIDNPTKESAGNNSRCNMVEGAFEGTLFPPNMKPNDTMKLFRRAFCRPVPFRIEENSFTKTGIEGVTARVDRLFLANPEENPENACYCVKGECLRKGLGSLAPCYYDMPIVISQPHFFNADPSLLDQVIGMKPNQTEHDSTFILHPKLGVPLQADLRIQINLDIGQTKYNSRTKPFNGLVLPLFWIELTVGDIPTFFYNLIILLTYVLPVGQQILMYLLGLGGLALMSGTAVFILFFSRDEPNGRLSFRGEYSPIPIIPMNSPYFKPEIRIFK